MDRFIVTSTAGEPAVRTNSRAEADRWLAVLGGEVIDQEAA